MRRFLYLLLVGIVAAAAAWGDVESGSEGTDLHEILRLSYKYQQENQLDSALLYLEEALPKVDKDSQEYEYVLMSLGLIYEEKEDAHNSYRILALMEEHNQRELQKECTTVKCHIEKAQYLQSTGKMADAREEYIKVFKMDMTPEERLALYNSYAQFNYSLHDFAEAGNYYEIAANSIPGGFDSTEEGVTLLQKAAVQFYLAKDNDKAVDLHKKVVVAVDAKGYSEDIKGKSLQGLRNVYAANEDYPNAIEANKAWIEHLKANGRTDGKEYAKAYEGLASVEKFNKEYDASIEDYNKAISLYRNLGLYDEAEQARTGKEMCYIYANKEYEPTEDDILALQQRQAKTEENLRQSLIILESSGDLMGKLFKAQTIGMIAGEYATLSQYDKSLDYYSQYLPLLREALAEDFLLKNPKERELTWNRELYNISEMGAMLAQLPVDSTGILYSKLSNLIYEGELLSKGLLLSSNIEFEKVLNRSGNQELLKQYEEVKRGLEHLDELRLRGSSVEEISELQRETDARQIALQRALAAEGMYTDFITHTSADVLAALADDEAAVEFATLNTGVLGREDMVVGIVISKEFPQGIAVPVGNVWQLENIIKDKDKFANNDYTTRIWENIVSVTPGKRRIYFAPSGVLNSLGIEYLTYNGTPISEVLDLVRLSSTRELCRTSVSKRLEQASLFGDIDYVAYASTSGEGVPMSRLSHPSGTNGTSGTSGTNGTNGTSGTKRSSADGWNFANLDNTAREIKEIDQILKNSVGKRKVNKFTGSSASKGEFMAQGGRGVNLLHVATHGMYKEADEGEDTDAMDRSILAFAGANLYDGIKDNEGIATASEIAGMQLQDCELVVLSACESGLGQLGSDGVFGLQRGFKNAGVKSMLVSLNEVSDRSTADMMISFYKHLMEPGATMRDALKSAQAEIRAKYPADDTWASFVLIDAR